MVHSAISTKLIAEYTFFTLTIMLFYILQTNHCDRSCMIF